MKRRHNIVHESSTLCNRKFASLLAEDLTRSFLVGFSASISFHEVRARRGPCRTRNSRHPTINRGAVG